jgi:hypothetical protein
MQNRNLTIAVCEQPEEVATLKAHVSLHPHTLGGLFTDIHTKHCAAEDTLGTTTGYKVEQKPKVQ